jgi:hypothetical protein
MPAVYKAPGIKTNTPNTTYYQLIAGKGAIFDGMIEIKIPDIVDGTANTIIVIEAEKPVRGDGKHLVTGTRDKTAILWHAAGDKKVQAFQRHSASIASVALSGDGKRVVTGSYDGTAILWDADNGKKLKTFPRHIWSMKVALSKDGKLVVTGTETPGIFKRRSVFSAILFRPAATRPLPASAGASARSLPGTAHRAALQVRAIPGLPALPSRRHRADPLPARGTAASTAARAVRDPSRTLSPDGPRDPLPDRRAALACGEPLPGALRQMTWKGFLAKKGIIRLGQRYQPSR